MTIGNRISELRKSKGFTQEYIAEQLGVSRQAVSKWEQDQTSPDTNNLIGLAQLLGSSVEYIATGNPGLQQTPKPTRKEVLEMINTKTTRGHALLICGLICLFLIPLLGLVLLVIGIIDLITAKDLESSLEPEEKSSGANRRKELTPWKCYSCGYENEGRVVYCINCNTSKAWSEIKWKDKNK